MRDAAARHARALDALTLLGLPRIGLREWHRRVASCGSAASALAHLSHTQAYDTSRCDADATLSRASTLGIRVVVHGETDYPVALHDLTACDSANLSPAPPVLFALGELSLLQQPAIAIVGTRHATATGLRAAERVARDCADAGALVISGLARGIDAAAHAGALSSTGFTAAVIGTGLDVAYPADHRGLQGRIARDGLLLSELPVGQRATHGRGELRARRQRRRGDLLKQHGGLADLDAATCTALDRHGDFAQLALDGTTLGEPTGHRAG